MGRSSIPSCCWGPVGAAGSTGYLPSFFSYQQLPKLFRTGSIPPETHTALLCSITQYSGRSHVG